MRLWNPPTTRHEPIVCIPPVFSSSSLHFVNRETSSSPSIFSTSPDVRTANLGTRPYVSRPSVFDRLGAEVPFPNVAAVKGSSTTSASVSATSAGKTALARVVDRTIASNAAEEARLRRDFAQSGPLKRSVSG